MKRNANGKGRSKRIREGISKAVNFLKCKVLVLVMAGTVPMTVWASDADTAWNSTMDTIQPWMTRIGLVLLVFGGIEFAIAQQSEDAAQKTRAGRFMIAGAIVIAVSTQLFPMLSA